MIPDSVLRVPVGGMLFGGMAAGNVAGFTLAALSIPVPAVGVVALAAGPVLIGSGLLGAVRFERTVGPFATRYAVDGAEQVVRRVVNLNWATKSGRIGALVSGIGLGLLATDMATLNVLLGSRDS